MLERYLSTAACVCESRVRSCTGGMGHLQRHSRQWLSLSTSVRHHGNVPKNVVERAPTIAQPRFALRWRRRRSGHMSIIARLLLGVVLAVPVARASDSLPVEFLGVWVPAKASCESPVRMSVAPGLVEFTNSSSSRLFPAAEPCFSCEGGARYGGIVVWLTPSGSESSSFVVRFNAGERKGFAIIEVLSAELQSLFPLNNVLLKKCLSPSR
jgi:hypothetical protein